MNLHGAAENAVPENAVLGNDRTRQKKTTMFRGSSFGPVVFPFLVFQIKSNLLGTPDHKTQTGS